MSNMYKNKYNDWKKDVVRVELEEKHLKNLQALPDRFALLDVLPKNAIVAEIGVDKGDFSEAILQRTKPEVLHLIDLWGSKRYGQDKRMLVEKKFEKEINNGSVKVNIGLSTEVVHQFEDNYFDWIYIDTDHTYETTKQELALYSKKIKPGGIISGHDFIIGNWNGILKYGVIEAVYEFCVKNDWELIYITMENTKHPSFAIRKL